LARFNVALTVNAFALVAVPAGVVTPTGPVVAPAGTVAWIAVSEVTEKVALVPLKVTVVAPVKPEPLIDTLVPTGPLAGAKLEIAGGGTTVKALLLVAAPAGVVTPIGPVVAPAGTVAWIAVFEVTEKVALVPLKVTVVAPLKLEPLIDTLVPTEPLAGAKPEIAGGGTTVNALLLVAVPADEVTPMGPVVAPAGTVAWIAVSEVTEKVALAPLNVTAVAPVKLEPLIDTLVPTGPLAGAKPAIAGGGTTVNALLLVAVPADVVTPMGPVEAPAGTVAWMAVSEVTENVALAPLNVTAVAPVKLVPLIETLVPAGPLVGVKPLIAGDRTTVNALLLVPVPAGVVTATGPDVAPAGTVAWMAVAELTVKLALAPLNVTAVAPLKFVPLIDTLVPTGPLEGVKLVIAGSGPAGSPPSHAMRVNAGVRVQIPTSPVA